MSVITSLPAEISAEEVLSCYRLRRQVELVFKRMESLLQLGNIPTKTKESGEVRISGKILLSLLTEKYLGDIDFSPHKPAMSVDVLELIQMSFIEKRKKTRQQLIQFLLS